MIFFLLFWNKGNKTIASSRHNHGTANLKSVCELEEEALQTAS